MDSATLAKMLGIFLLSAVKLLFAPGAGIASGLSLHQTALLTSSGGCCGVLFFYHCGYWLTERLKRYFHKKDVGGMHPSTKKKAFTKRNRLIVKVKYNFGMIGIAALTPAIISIPIGSVVAARLYWENRWMLPLLLISTVVWSVILTYFSLAIKQELFGW